MNTDSLTMNTLFEQLGLESSDEAIEKFLNRYSHIPQNLPLHEVSIWNRSQAAFLRQAIAEDSEWSYLVDHLDTMLRS